MIKKQDFHLFFLLLGIYLLCPYVTLAQYEEQLEMSLSSNEGRLDPKDDCLDLLVGMETLIDREYRQVILSGESLSKLRRTSILLRQSFMNTKLNPFAYWYAYCEYRQMLCLKSRNENKGAKQHLSNAIDILETLECKSSEEYALLSHLQRYMLQYVKKKKERSSLARKMDKNIEFAFVQNDRNVRAYVVSAINDFASPRFFGGGRLGERYLLKALNDLPEQTDATKKYLPRWGRREAYVALIRRYIKVKRLDEAREYLEELSEYYPNTVELSELNKLYSEKM